MKGYIKLFKQFQKWGWYDDANTVRVFLDILLNVNYEPSEYHGYKLEAGQGVFGRKKMAARLKISERSVRTAIEHLKSTNEITIKSTNKFSIITVVNWEKFQILENKATSKSTNKPSNERPTTDQQLTTEEEYKNIRNKECSSYSDQEELITRLSKGDVKHLENNYKEHLKLIMQVSEEVRIKRIRVTDPLKYIIGYAEKVGWEKC